MSAGRILLVDPNPATRQVLAARLTMQGYTVSFAVDGSEGAYAALADPPSAVVADLWMPSISGAQLCRLLKAEPSTIDVPVVLRGPEGRRNRFWAERAGAAGYVVTGKMGDLVRTLGRVIPKSGDQGGFFTSLPEGGAEVRDRIAAHLDHALFESVIAAEVRQLAVMGSFERLFDLFAQFVSQVTSYRWLALTTVSPPRLGLHCSTSGRTVAEAEARLTLGLADGTPMLCVEDEDAYGDAEGPAPLVMPVFFGELQLGEVVLSPRGREHADDAALIAVLARELGGALRVATLIEETQRLATVDAITGLRNRRAFLEIVERDVSRARRYGDALTVILVDIDHFKRVNDTFGHAAGDAVLTAVGHALAHIGRASDCPARWGGEEFVVALPSTNIDGGLIAAEKLRSALESLVISSSSGARIPITASFGVASCRGTDTIEALIDRADRAMYAAKSGGRNRVVREALPDEAGPEENGERATAHMA